MSLFQNPDQIFFDRFGNRASLGRIYFGEPGMNPKGPGNAKPPYLDPALSSAAGAQITLTVAGKLPHRVYLDGGYSILVEKSNGEQIFLDLEYQAEEVRAPATVQDIRDTNLSGLSSVTTLGYASAGDGGKATYYADTEDNSTADDGYQCIVSLDGVRFKLETSNRFSVAQAGALGGDNDTLAIQKVIDAAKAAYDAGMRLITLDLGSGEYSVSEGIIVEGINDLKVAGNALITATGTQNVIMSFTGCRRLKQIGRLAIYGNTTSTAYADRNNFIALLLDDCTDASLDVLDLRHVKADGLRLANGTSQPTINKLGVKYCGTGNSPSLRLPDVSWSHISASGGANSAAQRSVIELSTLPSDITTYMDTAWAAADNLNPVYIEIDGDLFYIESYSGSQVTIWPWVDPSKAGGVLARFIYGCGLYTKGGDVSVVTCGNLDISTAGIGILASALYPPAIASAVLQTSSIALATGTATSSAAEELTILRGYFENNLFDLVQVSQAATGVQIFSTTAFDWGKCYRMYSKNNSYVRARTVLEEVFIVVNGHEFKCLRAENRVQSSVAVEITNPEPYYLMSSGQSVLIECDEELQILTDKKTQLVYVYSESDGMAAGGTITFTPPSGATLNGLAADASQEFNTAVGPQVFLIARANATTFYVEPLGQSTVTKA